MRIDKSPKPGNKIQETKRPGRPVTNDILNIQQPIPTIPEELAKAIMSTPPEHKKVTPAKTRGTQPYNSLIFPREKVHEIVYSCDRALGKGLIIAMHAEDSSAMIPAFFGTMVRHAA